MSTKAERRAKKRASREEANARRFVLRSSQRLGWSRVEVSRRFPGSGTWLSRLLSFALTYTLRKRRDALLGNISANNALLARMGGFPCVDGGALITEPLSFDWKQAAVSVVVS